MKKKSKIIISLIVTAAIIGSVFAGLNLHALAQQSGTSGPLTWVLDGGVLTVSGTGYGDNYTVSNSKPNSPWYSYRADIHSVVVEGGVQALGDNWFYGCNAISTASLPATLVKIGASCFRGCTALQNITIPENCCEYYNYTFYGCTSLKWAVLPKDNSTSSYSHKIPDNTFYGCTNLENVWVGENYTAIGSSAFRNCSNITAIVWTGSTITSAGSYFPGSATFVGNGSVGTWCSNNSKNFINIEGSCGSALNYSYDLSTKTVNLTGSGAMTSAPWSAWKYFIYGADFGGAASVCDNAFYGCEYMTDEVELPASVTSVGANAFNGAGAQKYILYADSVTLSQNAFGGREDLVFYGRRNSGVYDYALSERTAHENWRYYCINNHFYGDNGKCVYCDRVLGTQMLEPCGEHVYIYQYRLGNKLYYKCSECDEADYCVSARDLLLDFDNALSTEGAAYTQANYDGRFDVLRDGYVNAKDYRLIADMSEGKATAYDMTLTNENATPEAKALYAYIAKTYKHNILSGQQESTWMGSPDYEMNYIYNNTGKYPAIRGLDFMNDDFSGVVSRARSWAQSGGIVTICWHCGNDFSGSFNESQADEFTPAQWEAVLTEGTSEHAAFIAGMDKAGAALLQLQNDGIPVLWRPFHEFDGGWFWWGKGGSEYFKRLWIMMYNHFTYDLGLNNLIWVLGYCHNGTDYGTDLTDWYPGSRYCDIVGADSYEVAQNGAEARLYNPIYAFVKDSKPMVMHETGLIPKVEQFQGVPWGYFMTWHTSYITDENTAAQLNTLYNSDYVITRDELPDLY